MGMDLSGAGGYFRWTTSEWYDLLEIASEFGWVPIGTGPPTGILKADWGDGTYDSNEGQRFYARDARAYANSLERALVAFSEGKAKKRTRAARSFDRLAASLTGVKKPGARTPVHKLNPEAINNIREFIAFCRAGSFRIY